MTITELRENEEYRTCMDKIRGYRVGFEFTIPFHRMSVGKANAMRIILKDAHAEGLIDCISFDFDRDGVITEETWRRI